MAEISSAEKSFVPAASTWTTGLPLLSITLKGQCFMSACTISSVNFLPISRLASYTVFVGLEDAWFLAASPISRWLSVVHAT